MSSPKRSDDMRRRLRAQIHIARKDLGLDDDTYRAALMRITGKPSSTNLSVPEMMRVVADFQEKGWKAKRKLSPRSAGNKHKTLVDKIRALWIDMGKAGIVRDSSEAALETWVRHQTSKRNGGIGVARVDWLEQDTKLAVMVIESLKRWQDRVIEEFNIDLRLISSVQAERDRPQADVVRELLIAQRIVWQPMYADLNIEPSPDYVTDRRLLRHV